MAKAPTKNNDSIAIIGFEALPTLSDSLLPQLLSGTLQIKNQTGLRHD